MYGRMEKDMKLKRTIAAAAALIMLLEFGSTAGAAYYSERELHTVSPEELVFAQFDAGKLDGYIKRIDEGLSSGSGSDITEALRGC